MKDFDIEKCEKICKEYSDLFSKILDPIVHKTIEFHNFSGSFAASLKKYSKVYKNIHEIWAQHAIVQYAMNKIFTKSGNFSKYLKNSFINQLDTNDKNKILFFKNNPWRYSFFTVSEVLENNFFVIYDYATQKEIVLKSKSVSNLLRSGNNLFFVILFNNGECFQTAGAIHAYNGLLPSDFNYFCKLINSDYEIGDDFSEIVEKNIMKFLMLDYYSQIPKIVSTTGDSSVEWFGAIWECDEIEPNDFKDECSITQKGDIFLFRVNNNSSTSYFSKIYYNQKKQELCIVSDAEIGYKNAIDVLSKIYDVDYEPEYHCSVIMLTAGMQILNKNFPPAKYESLFEKEQDAQNQEPSDELKNINLFLQELTDKLNNGEEYDLKECSKKYDIPLQLIQKMEKDIVKKYAIPKYVEGGIKGYKRPAPTMRRLFASAFVDSHFFTFNWSDKARSLIEAQIKKIKKNYEEYGENGDIELEANKFHEIIMHDFENMWMTSDNTLLQYTVYLLIKNGDRFISGIDYGKEVLGIFGHLFIKNNTEENVNEFLSIYVLDLLITIFEGYGLIELDDKRGAMHKIKIKASELFNEWIHLNDNLE